MIKSKMWICALMLFFAAVSAKAQDTMQNTGDDTTHVYRIHVLGRAYADKVALRWAPDEYVTWKILNQYGYVVARERLGNDDYDVDTLALVKPLSLEALKQHFAPTDSLAAVAAQMLYGKAVTLDNTETPPGTPGSIMEVYEEQQTYYSFGMLAAEMRLDIAEAMGLAYVDKTVKPGETYNYFVSSNVPDSLMMVMANAVLGVKPAPFKPDSLSVELTDSIDDAGNISLIWPHTSYSTYDIERSDNGGSWQKLNKQPFFMLTTDGSSDMRENLYTDHNVEAGHTYVYRVKGRDAFGEQSLPCRERRVYYRGLSNIVAPVMRAYEFLPCDTAVLARISFHKAEEESDYIGFLPYYRPGGDGMGLIMPLAKELTKDTVLTLNLTGLGNGYISALAFDKNGNSIEGMALPIQMNDGMPPSPPAGLRAAVSPLGVVTMAWQPCPEKDVAGYEVYFANDTLHTFVQISGTDFNDTIFIDTLSLNVNERYIYYRVHAVDFSGNRSDASATLAVLRPNFEPTITCRIDTAWQEGEKIYMRWNASMRKDVAIHRVFRRIQGSHDWELIGLVPVEAVKDATFEIVDSVPYLQGKRYIYAVETLNIIGVSSGLSMEYGVLHEGPRMLDVVIRLQGKYEEKGRKTVLAWDAGARPVDVPFWYVVYRRAAGEEHFHARMSVPEKEAMYEDYLLESGKEAEFYVAIQFEDGRVSTPSNVVKVVRPQAPVE